MLTIKICLPVDLAMASTMMDSTKPGNSKCSQSLAEDDADRFVRDPFGSMPDENSWLVDAVTVHCGDVAAEAASQSGATGVLAYWLCLNGHDDSMAFGSLEYCVDNCLVQGFVGNHRATLLLPADFDVNSLTYSYY